MIVITKVNGSLINLNQFLFTDSVVDTKDRSYIRFRNSIVLYFNISLAELNKQISQNISTVK